MRQVTQRVLRHGLIQAVQASSVANCYLNITLHMITVTGRLRKLVIMLTVQYGYGSGEAAVSCGCSVSRRTDICKQVLFARRVSTILACMQRQTGMHLSPKSIVFKKRKG
jgi:hypothetical protein